jgi:hypothetical protein
MGERIPKRGPAVVALKNGESLDLWYDPNPGCRLWVLQWRDAAGNQIGPVNKDGPGPSEASYHPRREWAVEEMQQILNAQEGG